MKGSKKRSAWAVIFIVALGLSTSLSAQRGRWISLGESRVDGSVDHDSIKVGRSDGTFRAIQLRIRGGAINFDRVIVRYGNGTQDEIQVRDRIPNGGKTRAIDLPGDRRVIESVDIWYGRDNWSKRPKVELYGMR